MGTSASISLETQVFRTEWLVTFPAVLHSSQPSSKILRSCFFFFFFFPRGARLYHTGSACFHLRFIARRKGASGLFISSERWLANFRYKRTDSARFRWRRLLDQKLCNGRLQALFSILVLLSTPRPAFQWQDHFLLQYIPTEVSRSHLASKSEM